jgi:chromosome segregation ATPase
MSNFSKSLFGAIIGVFVILAFVVKINAQELNSTDTETQRNQEEIQRPTQADRQLKIQELETRKQAKRLEQESKRAEQTAKRQSKEQELEALKLQREEKQKEIEAMHTEEMAKREARRAELQTRFTEIQVQRLETIKAHANTVTERYNKAAEKTYELLAKLDAKITEKEALGFKVTEQRQKLQQAQDKLGEIESEIENMNTIYANIEALSPEEVQTALNDLKSSSQDAKTQYMKIKEDLLSVVRSIK